MDGDRERWREEEEDKLICVIIVLLESLYL